MSQLVVDLPDEVYQPLMQQARETGKSPESLVAEWLGCVVRLKQDRLRQWAGAFTSGTPDAAVRHHEYLGRAILTERQEDRHG